MNFMEIKQVLEHLIYYYNRSVGSGYTTALVNGIENIDRKTIVITERPLDPNYRHLNHIIIGTFDQLYDDVIATKNLCPNIESKVDKLTNTNKDKFPTLFLEKEVLLNILQQSLDKINYLEKQLLCDKCTIEKEITDFNSVPVTKDYSNKDGTYECPSCRYNKLNRFWSYCPLCGCIIKWLIGEDDYKNSVESIIKDAIDTGKMKIK